MPTISSVADLLTSLNAAGPPRWYRGQIDAVWRLEPGVTRNRGWLEGELDMVKRFRQTASYRMRDQPHHEWEWVCLAQHYSVPTRLLDWSENPLVGLFFAVERDDSDRGPVDGRLFAIDPSLLNAKTSGTPTGVLLMGQDPVLDDYLPGATASMKRGPLAVVAPQGFDRIAAQSGVFTVSHRLDATGIDDGDPHILEEWEIPLVSKQFIRDELDRLNINASTVYPELSHIGEKIKAVHKT